MHIAAAAPEYVRREDVPEAELAKERDIAAAQVQGKPPAAVQKIVEGKLGSFYSQVVLLDQASIRDPKVSVSEVVAAANKALGASVSINRFARLKVGEGAAK